MAVAKIDRRLGRYQLQSLTPMQIERFYVDQLANGRRGGGALSAKTVRNVHVVLRKALADAERLGLVLRNAAAAARPPVGRPLRVGDVVVGRPPSVPRGDEGRTRFAAFVLLATTGMRRGEVLGLRWPDVDFDACTARDRPTR